MEVCAILNSHMITVSQLLRFVKSLLDEQKVLNDVFITGEVADLAFRSYSGHLYFTVTDGTSTIKCVMFNKYVSQLKKEIKKGDSIVIRGNVTVYEKDSTIQVIAYDIHHKGSGEKKTTLDELKKKLMDEGLFKSERKLSFCEFPKTIGVITSPEGAALQDIIATMAIRNPLVKIIVYPAVMQGDKSAETIIKALDFAEKENLCESYIIARGGGSSDDLSPFNDEKLARRISEFKYPVVSAVGHEIDTTILDLVADARAATPTAACTIICNSSDKYKDFVDDLVSRLKERTLAKYKLAEAEVKSLQSQVFGMSVINKLEKNEQKLAFLRKSLDYRLQDKLTATISRVKNLTEQLEILNPLNILKKGYSITKSGDNLLANCNSLSINDIIVTKFADGEVKSKVIDINMEV